MLTPSMNWTLDKDTQDIVDGIAGVMDINSSIVFCISKSLWKLWRVHARSISRFLTFEQNTPRVDKGAKFFKSSINTVALIC